MGNLVIAAYRPRPGHEQELLGIVREHVPALLRQGLVTNRAALVLQAEDGTLLELFEWKSEEAVERAHHDPVVREMWVRFERAAEMVRLADLAEAAERFPHFTPLSP